MRPTLHHADVLAYAAAYTGEPYHALLCDPPYHLTSITERFGKDGAAPAQDRDGGPFRGANRGFMGKQWDGGDLAFRAETWAAFWPLLHPGAFGMAFAGSRGLHRMMVAIEDAGYIIHPVIGWCYGSGFPKASRIDTQLGPLMDIETTTGITVASSVPRTSVGQEWAGHRYGLQALKPALEFIVVFQKPYQGRPVASMVATGAGALNIDGARIAGTGGQLQWAKPRDMGYNGGSNAGSVEALTSAAGRWPANLVLSHAPECERIGTRRVRSGGGTEGSATSIGGMGAFGGAHRQQTKPNHADPDGLETIDAWRCAPGCAVAALGAQSGELTSGIPGTMRLGVNTGSAYAAESRAPGTPMTGYGDTGTAARYFFQADYAAERLEAAEPLFYCAKASTAEREAGLSGRQRISVGDAGRHTMSGDMPYNYTALDGIGRTLPRANIHPTCKPIALARHLATLLLPPARYAPRRLFIPFAGVASECIGAMQAGWDHVDGVELEAEHVEIGRARIAWWADQGVQLTLFDPE